MQYFISINFYILYYLYKWIPIINKFINQYFIDFIINFFTQDHKFTKTELQMSLCMLKGTKKKGYSAFRTLCPVVPSIEVLESVTPSAIRTMMLKEVPSCVKCRKCLQRPWFLDIGRTLHTLGTKMVKCLPRKNPKRLKQYLKQYLSTVKIDMNWHTCKPHSKDVLQMLIDSTCDVSIEYSRVVLY